MTEDFEVTNDIGDRFVFARQIQDCTGFSTWYVIHHTTDDGGRPYAWDRGNLFLVPDSATKADILELFGLDKALAKSARCI